MMDNELYHHGILGMKWGVRNSETKARYLRSEKASQKRARKLLNRSTKITDKQMKLGKKIQKKRMRIEKHPHTPAVTFDSAQGLTLVFGARAHAIKQMKLNEMRTTYPYKFEKLNKKLSKTLRELTFFDETHAIDLNDTFGTRRQKYPFNNKENKQFYDKMEKGQWDKI